MMEYKTLVDKIDALPSLSDAVIEIQELYKNGKDNIDIPQLVELIESDALLVANILKVTNSPMYGFSRKISSISQAVTLFGILQIYALIINSAVDENIKANTEVYGLSNERFNDMCHIQTAILMKWYSKVNFKDAQTLSSLVLIMESGKLIRI